MKKIIQKYFKNLVWFYNYIGYKIFFAFFLSTLVGFLDGFGLTMFLPLLNVMTGDEQASFDDMGNLSFISQFIETSGFEVSLILILQLMILFFVLKAFTKYLNDILKVILQQKLILRLRIDLLKSINNLNYKFFAKSNIGRIQNTMTGELTRIQTAYDYYFQILEQSVLVIVYMAFAYYVDFKFALLITVAGALANLFYKAIHRLSEGLSLKFSADNNTYEGQVIQHITNFKYLKATGSADNFAGRLINTIKKIETSRKKLGILNSLIKAVREPLLIIIVSSVILLQTYFLGGEIAPIIISLLFFFRALSSLTQLQHNRNMFLANSGSIKNLQSFQEDLKTNQIISKGDIPYKFKNKIELSNLSFSYDYEKILDSVSLEILKNQTVALIGESGSGKTTLVNLISGLISSDSGNLFIDGIGIRDLDKNSFHKKIGYITQEPVIFNDSVFNNVTFWDDKNDKNIKRFYAALKKASLFETVASMKLKEDQLLGNNGINLSGGQKQRISIARELYKDVEILIMDEATSALDTETEKRIQENIEGLKGKYTIIVIAHRISTIKNVDSVILLDKGKIIETGTFSHIIEKYPQYSF
jgi:ABC-type multidrug transport system fused ATPase/permease subunit